MTRYDFRQLDVFSPLSLSGNPLAVVVGADDLDGGQRQAFARWTGLAETTFLSAPTEPGADYRVHIHTPERELPFAGHPTLGSAAAWLSTGGRPTQDGQVVQQCAAGLVPVRVDGRRFAFAAPPLTRYEPVEPEVLNRVAVGLGLAPGDILDASWLVNGPEWLGVRLASAEQVLGVQLVPAGVLGLDIGVVGPHAAGSEVQFEVRAFIPGGAVPEDPVTGSLNAGLAHWLMDTGQASSSYVAAQGTAIGGAGRVHVQRDAEGLWIGGDVTLVVSGIVELPARSLEEMLE